MYFIFLCPPLSFSTKYYMRNFITVVHVDTAQVSGQIHVAVSKSSHSDFELSGVYECHSLHESVTHTRVLHSVLGGTDTLSSGLSMLWSKDRMSTAPTITGLKITHYTLQSLTASIFPYTKVQM